MNRLDEQAARERVMRLATTTTQGAGALEAIQGCLSSMPGVTNNRLALFRYPSVKCPLDTVALNLIETRWVVAFDALANAPRRPGDPPFCFGITHPALTVRATLVPIRPRSRGERRSLRTFSPDQPTRRSTARPPITHQSRRATSPSTVVHVFFHPRHLDSPIRSRRVVVVRIPQPAKTPPGEDPIPPKEGDVGLVCRMVDAYHDNKEERLYVTSQVVGRFRVDRVVTDGNPFFVAETSQARSYSHWSPYELVRVVNADP